MNIEAGQFIQVRFTNGIFFDATVEKWSDAKSVLVLPDGDKVIIFNTLQNILLVKILENKQLTSANSKEEIVQKLEEEKQQHNSVRSVQRMSELKDELNKLEREERLQNMKTFKPDGLRKVNYGLPRDIQIGSASQYTDQEAASTNSAINSELQILFSKKY